MVPSFVASWEGGSRWLGYLTEHYKQQSALYGGHIAQSALTCDTTFNPTYLQPDKTLPGLQVCMPSIITYEDACTCHLIHVACFAFLKNAVSLACFAPGCCCWSAPAAPPPSTPQPTPHAPSLGCFRFLPPASPSSENFSACSSSLKASTDTIPPVAWACPLTEAQAVQHSHHLTMLSVCHQLWLHPSACLQRYSASVLQITQDQIRNRGRSKKEALLSLKPQPYFTAGSAVAECTQTAPDLTSVRTLPNSGSSSNRSALRVLTLI
jgi:hypothetical protein